MYGTSAKTSSTVEIVNITPHRRWPVGGKVRLIEASMAPGQSVSLVGRAYGVALTLLYRWRRQMSEGGKTAIEANDEVVSVAEVKAQKSKSVSWNAFLATKRWKWKFSRKPFALVAKKTHLAAALVRRGGFPVKRVTEAMAVPRSNTYERSRSPRPRPERYSKAEDVLLLPLIGNIWADARRMAIGVFSGLIVN
ncbi:Transposase [Desulfovibrio desulfuricans]|uniref:Transposase n=1 Tax=Desulfovibrio desulfuricans TaxID=876 RepID=A0AA94L3K1_DESDE|nr:Transposase [Desulfovibrio desulfuricans]SPD36003.1 Transposase [Desulfovibrio sp. G11]